MSCALTAMSSLTRPLDGFLNKGLQDCRHFEKNPLNCHISATISPILMQFSMLTHNSPLQRTNRKLFEFLKIQDGGGRHLENHENLDVSATV